MDYIFCIYLNYVLVFVVLDCDVIHPCFVCLLSDFDYLFTIRLCCHMRTCMNLET